MAKLGSLTYDLVADTSKFSAGLSRAERLARKKSKGISDSMAKVGNAMALIGGAGTAALIAGSIRTFSNFEKSISDLSAITGATGKDLDFLSNKARELGKVTTLSATQVADGFRLIASAKPELLGNSAALAMVTKETIALAEASGIDMVTAAEATANALNQYGAGAEQAARFVNVLAAGSKLGSSEVFDTAEALQKAGTVAKIAGVSFEELNANIQGLASVGIKGADAGTALRNVLTRLQSQSNDKLNPAIVGLSQAIKNLGEENLSTADLVKLVGERTFAATSALIEQGDAATDLTKALTGTNIAYEQQARRTDNLQGDVDRLKSAYEELQIEIGSKFNPSLREATQLLTEFLNAAALGLPDLENFLVRGIAAWNTTFLELGASMAEALAAMETFSAKVTFGDTSARHLEQAKMWTGRAVDLWARAADETEIQIQALEDKALRAQKALLPPASVVLTPPPPPPSPPPPSSTDTKEQRKQFESLRISLLGEEEQIQASYQRRLEMLMEFQNQKVISDQEFAEVNLTAMLDRDSQLMEIERKRAEERKQLEEQVANAKMNIQRQVVNNAIGLLQLFGQKNKGFAIAAIVLQKAMALKEIALQHIKTQQMLTMLEPIAIAQAMAQLGPIAGPPAAKAIKAQFAGLRAMATAGAVLGGILQVASGIQEIQNLNSGGSTLAGGVTGVSGVDPVTGFPVGNTRQAATYVTINIGNNKVFSDEAIRELIGQINNQIDDGVVIKGIRVS